MVELLTDYEFELFRKRIYDESGITFSDTNRSILDSRIKERLREKQFDTVDKYYNLICSDKEEMKVFLDSVTTNLTRFFRNQAHWDAFVKYVIPKVIENKKRNGESIIKRGYALEMYGVNEDNCWVDNENCIRVCDWVQYDSGNGFTGVWYT